ncbi:MAG TPA: magnesium/cobalt transporter CorA, partial [Anaerolineaceae bacterium]|nr:magnesium/cobalt transporter CorA [Anaerolineaceae bacterium]
TAKGQSMIRTMIYQPGEALKKCEGVAKVADALQKPDALVWVSLEHATDDEINTVLRDTFHFHPLPIEDCMSMGYQSPKIDDFGDYLFIIAHAIHPNGSFDTLDTMEVNFFLGMNYMVTCYRDEAVSTVETVWQNTDRDERLYQHGADFLCHALLDVLVDEYMPVIDRMDQEIEWLEDRVLAKPEPRTLERILAFKHAVMSLRRILNPQREVMNRLSRDEFSQIDQQSRIYYRDIYDHLVRIQDLTELIRDVISGAMDIYLNSNSLRMNEIMKALTIVSTIFLPLSFIAGVYGMNFHFMPELSQPWAYPAIWVLFVVVAGGMLYFFKRRGWF